MNITSRAYGTSFVGIVVALALAMTACGVSAASPTNTDSNKALTKIRITVTHFPTLLYAVPYIVAMEKGFFQDEGIKITEIAGSEGGGTTVRNVVTGGLPFGEVATPAAAQAYARGFPLVAIGGGVQSVADLNWVTVKDSPIDDIHGLVGKSATYTSPGSVTQGILALSLYSAGIDPSKVNMQALGGIGEGLTALQGGAVAVAADLVPVFYLSPENKYDVVWWADELVSDFQQTVIITSAKMVKENPELVRSFLKARARGVQWIHEHPDQAAEMWAQKADFDPNAAKKSVRRVLKDDYWGIGFTEKGLSAVSLEMHTIDLVPEDTTIDWGSFVNENFLPKGTEKIDPSKIQSQ